jgi:hypothetical protein
MRDLVVGQAIGSTKGGSCSGLFPRLSGYDLEAARQFGLDSDSSFFPNPPPAKIRRGSLSNQSAISSIFYDPKSQPLDIEFKSSGVPNDEYQRLLKAASKGAYLNPQIKPKYRTRKIL